MSSFQPIMVLKYCSMNYVLRLGYVKQLPQYNNINYEVNKNITDRGC